MVRILRRSGALIAISDDWRFLVALKDRWLQPQELEDLGALRNRIRWEQSVAARVLLKRLIQRKFQTKALSGRIFRKTSGGLSFRGGKRRVCLSVSHSEGWIAAAISDRAVGIDVQKRRPLKDDRGLFRRIAHKGDLVSPRLRTLDLWALKEAVMKAHGRGLISQVSLMQRKGLQFGGRLHRSHFNAELIRISRDMALAWAQRL